MQNVQVVALAAAMLIFVVCAVHLFIIGRDIHLWMQSYFACGKITFFDLVGMSYRGVDRRMIVKAHIQAVQGGLDIPVPQLEAAYLVGGNVPRIVLAAVTQKKRGEQVDFDSLLAADLEDRLAEELNLR